MTYLKYDLNDKRVQYLIRTDVSLGKLIQYIGTSELVIEKDGFKCLVKYIIGQQISDKARETIWQRICTALNNVTPNTILLTSDSILRGIGLSGRKVEYIKILATEIVTGRIDLEKFLSLTNEEIVAELIALKGIGRWTAEMYLIFSLGRENVLSKGDGTIRRTIQWMYALEKPPSAKEVAEYFADWTEYANDRFGRIICVGGIRHNKAIAKKFLNILGYKNFQWNSRMHSCKSEHGYSIGKY